MKKSIIFLMTAGAAVLSGCGGGGGGGAAAPSPTPDILIPPTDFDELTPAARAKAINARQILGSVTQSSRIDSTTNTTLDRVRAKTDADGNLMVELRDQEGLLDPEIIIENTEQGWEGSSRNNPPEGYRLISSTALFGGDDLEVQTFEEHEPSDYYLVSGFWFRDDSDFGVFADGSELTEELPTSGNATYRGGAGGIYWERETTLNGIQVFYADAEFRAVYSGNNLQLTGSAHDFKKVEGATLTGDLTTDFLVGQVINFEELTYDTVRNGVIDGNLNCNPGCDVESGSWGGQFFGNPPDGTNGWPFAFLGTFGLQGISSQDNNYDMLGTFRTIHADLSSVPPGDFNGNGYPSIVLPCNFNADFCAGGDTPVPGLPSADSTE